jgi:SpoIID/LytB domain protein
MQRTIGWCAGLLAVTLVLLLSCQRRGAAQAEQFSQSRTPAPTRAWDHPAKAGTPAPAVATKTPNVAPRQLPRLDSEPIVSVLLDSGPRVQFTLMQEAQVFCSRKNVRLGPGPVSLEFTGSGMRLSPGNFTIGDEARFDFSPGEPQARFSVPMHPPFGKPATLSFSGSVVLAVDKANREIQLMERIGLEQYLAGVLPVEMNPKWPLEALKAQAVAARSYAAARILERFDGPWQLHWHYSVDMAYGGFKSSTSAVQTALKQTAGNMLMYRGMPVFALFYASSGGTTESVANLWPVLLAADQRTSFAAVMASHADPACEGGAAGLKLRDSHWRWKADIPFKDINDGLHAWSAEKSGRPKFGTVTGVKTVDRFGDSNRVARVLIRHKVKRKEIETTLAAHDFRMAVGPGIIRSTYWDRCVAASKNGGTLVLEGRGFGHGVGMSQVSAWQMASEGQSAMSILRSFYPGAPVLKRW